MSITGQVGHVAIAKQWGGAGAPDTNPLNYRAVKITGDSLVANNNMLVAEGEIGTGRDVTQAIPGGFAAAGAINGNLRTRSAAVFLDGALGLPVDQAAGSGLAHTTRYDPDNSLPYFTIQKKIGDNTPAGQQLVLQYEDAQVNTLNISVPSAGLATFSAGIVAAGESTIPAGDESIVDPDYTDPDSGLVASDELLVFHGGRIKNGDTGGVLSADDKFQSFEVVINNNIATDEYTIRPSRFLRSMTEGIRSVEANLTIVFEDEEDYKKYTYGDSGRSAPGYSLYNGAIEFFLGNWQVDGADNLRTEEPTNGPDLPQGVQFNIPKLAFAGLPVALASGRIAVTTTARALKPEGENIIEAIVRPYDAGLWFD